MTWPFETSHSVSLFERVVQQLCHRADFRKESRKALFYHILDIAKADARYGKHINLKATPSQIAVREGEQNRIAIYHYYPETTGGRSSVELFDLKADYDERLITFGGSDKQRISADYDVAYFDFRVHPDQGENSTNISIVGAPLSEHGLTTKVDFTIDIVRSWQRIVWRFGFLWLGLSVATLSAYYFGLDQNQDASYLGMTLIVVASFFASVGAFSNIRTNL